MVHLCHVLWHLNYQKLLRRCCSSWNDDKNLGHHLSLLHIRTLWSSLYSPNFIQRNILTGVSNDQSSYICLELQYVHSFCWRNRRPLYQELLWYQALSSVQKRLQRSLHSERSHRLTELIWIVDRFPEFSQKFRLYDDICYPNSGIWCRFSWLPYVLSSNI